MPEVNDQLLNDIRDEIVKATNPSRIILFGSYARDEAGPDSDLDILIVEDDDFGLERSRRKELGRLWRLLAKFRVPKDILIFSIREIEELSQARNHIVSHVLREGKTLYER